MWPHLLDLAPDVALLQEVGSLPECVRARFRCEAVRAMGKSGAAQKFSTAILVRGQIGEVLPLRGPAPWVDAELDRFRGNLLAHAVVPNGGPALRAVSVYSPAWPVDRNRLEGIDVSSVRLTQNRDVWVADLLWAALAVRPSPLTASWVVAGDFNLSETFDLWPGGPRGNREYLDRMAELGFVECLRSTKGELTPTYRHTNGAVKHQMDHLFVTQDLVHHLRSCDVGSAEEVFGRGLSDHLPIVADFDLTGGAAPPAHRREG